MKPLLLTLTMLAALALFIEARTPFAPPLEDEKSASPAPVNTSGNQNGSDSKSKESEVAEITGRYGIYTAVLGLVGVVITAVLGLIGVITTAVLGRAKTNEKTNALTDAVAKSLEESVVNKIEAIRLDGTVLDLTGKAIYRVTYKNLYITREGATLKNFTGSVGFSPPNSKIIRGPVVTWSEHLKADKSLRQPEVEIDCPDSEGKSSCDFTVDIGSELTFGERLSYLYEVEASNGVYMSKEDVEANPVQSYRKEYWSFTINGLVDELEISVNFVPKGYRPIARAGVWVGSNLEDKYIDNQELKRVEGGFQQSSKSTSAYFKIRKPRLGFTYAIYWIPLERKQVEDLIASQV